MNKKAVEQVKNFACHNKCSPAQLETAHETEEKNKICVKDLKTDQYFWLESQCLLFEINCQGDRGKEKLL